MSNSSQKNPAATLATIFIIVVACTLIYNVGVSVSKLWEKEVPMHLTFSEATENRHNGQGRFLIETVGALAIAEVQDESQNYFAQQDDLIKQLAVASNCSNYNKIRHNYQSRVIKVGQDLFVFQEAIDIYVEINNTGLRKISLKSSAEGVFMTNGGEFTGPDMIREAYFQEALKVLKNEGAMPFYGVIMLPSPERLESHLESQEPGDPHFLTVPVAFWCNR